MKLGSSNLTKILLQVDPVPTACEPVTKGVNFAMTTKLIAELSELVLQVIRATEDAPASPRTVNPMDNLVSDHGLTSLTFISLVVAIEQQFDVTFVDDELLAENFETVQAIADLLKPKLEQRDPCLMDMLV